MNIPEPNKYPLSLAARDRLNSLPNAFVSPLSARESRLVLEAFFLLDYLTEGCISPRDFQLEATLAILAGKDVVLRAGTGYGKTLVMILVCLLRREKVMLTVSPLKMLQQNHVEELARYHICAIQINKDTPNDLDLWKDITSGAYSNYFIALEQFFPEHGHIPRMALLLKDPPFLRKIGAFFVDEAHFIDSAGTPKAGKPAFRPPYARLGEVRLHLLAAYNFGRAAISCTWNAR